jgi:SAM-dependent methyltransferase
VEEQNTPAPIDLEELLETLRSRVDERRRSGAYPPGLEADLDAHFHRVVATKAGPDRSRIQSKLDRLAAFSAFRAERIPVASNIPGGSAAHRMISRAAGRQTQGILDQVQQFADALLEVLDALVYPAAEPGEHEHPQLTGMVDAIIERLAAYERAPVASAAGLADLHRRLEVLERSEARRQFRPWFSKSGFVDELRGSWTELSDRYRDIAERLADSGPVLDVGCGRGELLALLQQQGVEASGVELDPALAEEARARGLSVEQGDGLARLAETNDGWLGGIVLIQVLEYLEAQDVADVVLLARDKLRPGGMLVIEAVNPQSVYVMSHSFYVDPARLRPVHPAYVDFLAREAGFGGVEIAWRSPPPEHDRFEEDAGGESARVADARRLNRLLVEPQDYVLIARR